MNDKNVRHPIRRYWEPISDQDIFEKLIGFDFGPEPLKQIQAIRAAKADMARYILKFIRPTPNCVGIEIGSGCGFLLGEFASRVAHIYGTDISERYLEYARRECLGLPNVSFVQIRPGGLNAFHNKNVDFVFSNNVFIHLDVFEILDYLEECWAILKPGGKVWFDFLEIERLDSPRDPEFSVTRQYRRDDPFSKCTLQYNSSVALEKFAVAIGYKVDNVYRGSRCNTQLLLRK